MATKIFFAPYVHGPELNSEAAKPSPLGACKRWFKKIRIVVRAVLSSPDRPSTATANSRNHWAYRVANYQQDSAANESSLCQRQLPFGVEGCDLELEAIEPAKLQPGDVIVVEAGQTLLTDGTIVAGIAIVDESAITGQSEPLVCSAESRARVMRDSCVVAGRILLRVAIRRGHPLDWIETPPMPHTLTQSALRPAAVRS